MTTILEEDQGMFCMSQGVKLTWLAQSFQDIDEYAKRDKISIASKKWVVFWYDQF